MLLETDGGVLLSIPGIGVTLAAELTAEMGDLEAFINAGQLLKMAGTNPVVKQSSGKQAIHFAISKQGRAQFRSVVFHTRKCRTHHNPDMNAHFRKMEEKGELASQAYIAIGDRIVRLAYAMRKQQTLYQSTCPDYILKKVIAGKLRNKSKQAVFFYRFVSV